MFTTQWLLSLRFFQCCLSLAIEICGFDAELPCNSTYLFVNVVHKNQITTTTNDPLLFYNSLADSKFSFELERSSFYQSKARKLGQSKRLGKYFKVRWGIIIWEYVIRMVNCSMVGLLKYFCCICYYVLLHLEDKNYRITLINV